MALTPTDDGADRWGDGVIGRGERADVSLIISESYAGANIAIPLHVWRGRSPGPVAFVSAAVHGDEINGTGAIRHIITEKPFELVAGTLVLVPVVNLLGFERHSRYLPDRRDLNRSFPGSSTGSLASRMARVFFDEVVSKSQFGIDLHTAAVRRTNFPNVRADMGDEAVAGIARAFGTELIVSGKGPKGSLRRAACGVGCSTIILEAGEVWKVEPTIVEHAVRGIRNCLVSLGMVGGSQTEPEFRVETDATAWVRALHGGFLRFHVAPGDTVERGDAIATNTSLTGREQNVIESPRNGIVLGMTTLPAVAPGDPVCHLAYQKKSVLQRIERAREDLDSDSLHERTRDALSSSMLLREAGDRET